MRLEYQNLARPTYVLGGDSRHASPLRGLKAAGPYKHGDCPRKPRLLFVFADEFKDLANRLFLALRNGIGPFQGVEPVFRFSLETSSVERVASFSVRGMDDHQAADAYLKAVQGYLDLQTSKPPPDLALILHRHTDADDQHNPYLSSKYPLLASNIPTQVVTTDLVERTDQFQWSAANIALAMFAKMGGQPWAVETPFRPDTLVVGMTRVSVGPGQNGASRRFWGIASTFSHQGLFVGTDVFPPADTWGEYLAGLKTALDAAVQRWSETVSGPAALVLHLRKEIGREEEDVIQGVLASAGPQKVRSYAVMRLVESTERIIVDPSDDAGLPLSGTLVRLAGHRALLQVAGRDPTQRTVGKTVIGGPWQVTKVRSSEDAPPFDVLCGNVLDLAAMNWRGLNAEASPVSVGYSQAVATILGRFAQAGFDVSRLQNLSVLKRVWFI